MDVPGCLRHLEDYCRVLKEKTGLKTLIVGEDKRTFFNNGWAMNCPFIRVNQDDRAGIVECPKGFYVGRRRINVGSRQEVTLMVGCFLEATDIKDNGMNQKCTYNVEAVPVISQDKILADLEKLVSVCYLAFDLKALEKQERRLQKLFKTANSIMVIHDLQGIIKDINDAGVEMIGKDTGQILGKHINEFFDIASADQSRFLSKGKNKYEFTASLKGTKQTMDVHATLVGGTNHLQEILLVMHDVTAHKQTIKDMAQSERLYRVISENMSDIICLHRPNGSFLYVSPSVKDLLGYKPQDLVDKMPGGIIYKNDVIRFSRLDFKGAQQKKEIRVLKKDGGYEWFETLTKPVVSKDGSLVHFISASRPVTDRRKYEKALKRSEEEYKGIFESVVNGILILSNQGIIVETNPAACKFFGYEYEELIGLEAHKVFHTNSQNVFASFIKVVSRGEEFGAEALGVCKNGDTVAFEVRGTTFMYKRKPHLIAIITDITKRREAYQKVEFLNQHDNMTGLSNRIFFEKELNRLNFERQFPFSVIIADVNGLKLINDTFGHFEGDRVLMQIADILKRTCRKEDIICRWGGDEFAILLPRTKQEMANKLCHRIKEVCKNSYAKVPISLSLGVVTRKTAKGNLHNLLNNAEEKMYRNKILEASSFRNSILKFLERSLYEKSNETEAHAQRLQQAAAKIWQALADVDHQLEDLLIIAALHDIGKIAVPESILKKKGSLSSSEWQIIKKHPEVGFRIAKAVPDLKSIAKGILHHHEWWNGKGYPASLKGKDIPLISRIIAIVDAYDVMVNGRPYKKAMTKNSIIKEFKKEAGRQFDPLLTDIFLQTELL